MTTETIHKLADNLGVSWDGDKNFMDWCSQIVGKKHLDDMSGNELLTIYTHLKNGWYSNGSFKEVKEADYVMGMIKNEMSK